MASKQPGVWGIDLGQCALKALRLEKINGTLTATAFDYIEHPKILSQPDADPDQLTREALETFLSRNPVKGDTLIISVPGQTGLARFVKLPPVEPKKIPDIVRFEAKQQIPFPLDEVVWDWQIIGKRGEAEGFVENEIGLFAMKRDMVARYLQTFKDVGVEVQLVQMSPLATCNYITYDVLNKEAGISNDDGGKQDCVVALDMGVDNTNMVITDGERVIWQRPIPIGGNHFTRALTKEMKLTFAKAEHLKRNATKAEDPKRLFQCMKPVFTDFLNELQRSLGFFTNTHRTAQVKRVVALGNSFRLPGLQKFLSQSLNVEVEKFSEFNRLVGDEVKNSSVFADNILSFAVPYGLALQGHKVTRIQTNLLPQDVQMERFVRSKKPWIVSAAAALLVGATAFAWASGAMWETSNQVRAAAEKANVLIGDEQTYRAEFKKKMDALKEARLAAQRIIRGSEERTNWSLFYRFLNDTLPQPDGRNLASRILPNEKKSARDMYWNDDAERALANKRERDERNERKNPINLNDLVQINVQTIYQRYCDPGMIDAYLNNVKKRGRSIEESWNRPGSDWVTGNGRPQEPIDPSKPVIPGQLPPRMVGGWWAIEIHGYTYHKEKSRFVMNTFLDNLRETTKVRWPLNSPHGKDQPVHVSHVALLKAETSANPIGANETPRFEVIGSTIYLNELLKPDANPGGGGAPGGAPPGGGGGGGMQGINDGPPGGGQGAGNSPKRDSWSPIQLFTPGMGGEGGGGMGGGNAGGGNPPPIGVGGGTGGGGNNPPPIGLGGGTGGGSTQQPNYRPPAGGGAPAMDPKDPANKLRFYRTEFVVVLLWFEPLPTESIEGLPAK